VRFPVDYELYRRYEEVTQWGAFVAKHFPGQAVPATAKARQNLHKQLDLLEYGTRSLLLAIARQLLSSMDNDVIAQ
jgi:hypothetical protein